MAKYLLSSTEHQVFNEFDRHGLLLSLPRLPGEKNASYKRRLMDVMVHRSNSTYLGLIYGMTRELGLSISDAIQISPIKNVVGEYLVPDPAIVFEGTKCYLYNEYSQDDIYLTIDRWEKTGGAYTLQELTDTINSTGVYTATLSPKADATAKAMTIFHQSSIKEIEAEDISEAGTVVNLAKSNLVPNSVTVVSPNLVTRRNISTGLSRGEYYINLVTGTIIASEMPYTGSSVRYLYRDDNMIFQSSPVIIHDIHSDDFRTKMFEQVIDDTNTSVNGRPTVLGAEIINELLSVNPTVWGK